MRGRLSVLLAGLCLFSGCAEEDESAVGSICDEFNGIYRLDSYQLGDDCVVDDVERLMSDEVAVSHALVACAEIGGEPLIEVQSCDDLESCLEKERSFAENTPPPLDMKSGAFTFVHGSPSWDNNEGCAEVIYAQVNVSVNDGALLIERERWRFEDVPEAMGEDGVACDEVELKRRAEAQICSDILVISGELEAL